MFKFGSVTVAIKQIGGLKGISTSDVPFKDVFLRLKQQHSFLPRCEEEVDAVGACHLTSLFRKSWVHCR